MIAFLEVLHIKFEDPIRLIQATVLPRQVKGAGEPNATFSGHHSRTFNPASFHFSQARTIILKQNLPCKHSHPAKPSMNFRTELVHDQ